MCASLSAGLCLAGKPRRKPQNPRAEEAAQEPRPGQRHRGLLELRQELDVPVARCPASLLSRQPQRGCIPLQTEDLLTIARAEANQHRRVDRNFGPNSARDYKSNCGYRTCRETFSSTALQNQQIGASSRRLEPQRSRATFRKWATVRSRLSSRIPNSVPHHLVAISFCSY